MSLLNKINENSHNIYKIYCDMDGVLCDFEKRFEHYTGLFPDEYRNIAIKKYGEKKGIEKFWDLIDNQVGIRYWRGMGWMPDAQLFWNFIKKYKPTILTAPSKHENSRIGKNLWVQDNLGPNYEIIFSNAQDKCRYASPISILIDDSTQNILDWKREGGIGILYKNNPSEVIKELNKLGIK